MNIEKLDINTLFPGPEKYEENKRKYIAEYEEYIPGYSTGFFGWRDGRYENRPDVAKVKWDKAYPKGFEDWREKEFRCSHSDLKVVEQKINEIIFSLTKNN